MSSGFWGGFGAGFAKTFDPVVVGKGLGEAVADYKEGKAVEAAEEKKKQAIATLDKERFQSGGTPQGPQVQLSQQDAPQVDLSAVPNPSAGASGPVAQGQAIDPNQVVSAKDVAPGNPMSDATYDRRMAEIENDYKNATQQARADYYRFRGMNKEQEEAEKKLKDMQFAQKFGMFHRRAVEGDKDALGQVVRYANNTLGDGTEIKVGDDGRMSMWQNGKVVQENFVPTRAQIDQMAMSMYNNARFFSDGDFDSYLGRSSTIQGMDLAQKKSTREDAALNETIRHNTAQEGLTKSGQAITLRGQNMDYDLGTKKIASTEAIAGQKDDTERRGQNLRHVAEMSKQELAKAQLEFEREKANLEKNGFKWAYDKETGEEVLRGGPENQRWATLQDGIIVPDGMTKDQVLANKAAAKELNADYSIQYFPDKRTGAPVPRLVFRVGDYYTTTLDEARGLAKDLASTAEANVAGGKIASKPEAAPLPKEDKAKPKPTGTPTRTKIEQADDERVKSMRRVAKTSKEQLHPSKFTAGDY